MEDSPRKKICESNDNSLDGEGSKMTEDECSQYLTYDVLRIIFKYLSGMELSNASLVCRLWLEAANHEKRTRRGLVHLLKNLSDTLTEDDFECSKTQLSKDLWIKPALGLFFVNCNIGSCEKECRCKVFPSNCHSVTLGVTSIIYHDEILDHHKYSMLGVFLPEIPGVSVNTFKIRDGLADRKDIYKYHKQYSKEIRKVLNKPKKGTISKCLLLFCEYEARPIAMYVANLLKNSYRSAELSVWGGIVDSVQVCNSKDRANGKRQCERLECTAVTLVGPITTWSTVIRECVDTEEQIEQQLELFRHRISLKKHSIGMMFACSGRVFDNHNVESSLFTKIFPEVPLMGCVGYGEFGENNIRMECSDRDTNSWYDEMSCVFLIITYG